jgi:hypothetical protein
MRMVLRAGEAREKRLEGKLEQARLRVSGTQ